ncbi:sugar transporter domain-containing protein [Hirsutella rhossiliensis]|uniref:Sugar transporter domain-containing protein n=1 Tax=Hirsutella rhossiliensis TaxID=111463 RepID=A0A9P8MTU9_9HYPO|nr:sugar transporter domain-containing protein [Hirsutella rhossiliensis]XP_044718678.1 sugar transporter domain-containing protein [Hirsutella rhossiliensis]KAH0956937.1 sugar transporter domain-containing protein [Hirsutella rhossiliensis]KAH0961165.1 sugar transporter domain-containing protein [Hirsutella rhossiliensis]
MGFDLHTGETNDPKSVRNWCIHMMANIASMSAIAMGYDTSVISDTMALDSFRLDIGLLSALGTYRHLCRRDCLRHRRCVHDGGNGLLAMLIVGCAVAGLGIRASPLIVPVYIAETEITSQGGDMLGFWAAQWIVPLGLRLVRGALLLLGMLKCPESLRWLANHDRWGEAEKVFVGLRALPADPQYIRGELSEIHQ